MDNKIKKIVNKVLDKDSYSISCWYQLSELHLDVPDTDYDWYVMHQDCDIDLDQVIDEYAVLKTNEYLDKVLKELEIKPNSCDDKFLEHLYDEIKGELVSRAKAALLYVQNKIPQDFIRESADAFETIVATEELIAYIKSVAPDYKCNDFDFFEDKTLMGTKKISFSELQANPEKYPLEFLYTMELQNENLGIILTYEDCYKGKPGVISIFDKDTIPSLLICERKINDWEKMNWKDVCGEEIDQEEER